MRSRDGHQRRRSRRGSGPFQPHLARGRRSGSRASGARCRGTELVSSISSERIASIEARRHELQQAMSRGDLAPDEFVRLSKDYAAIEPVAAAAREVRRLRAELDVLNGLVADATAEPALKQIAAGEAEEIRHKLTEAERAPAAKSLPPESGDDRAA